MDAPREISHKRQSPRAGGVTQEPREGQRGMGRDRGTPDPADPPGAAQPPAGLDAQKIGQEMLCCHLPRSVVFVVAVAISKYYHYEFLDKN